MHLPSSGVPATRPTRANPPFEWITAWHADRLAPPEGLRTPSRLGSNRPERLRRDAEEREIVRRKTFATRPLTVADAADEMELLDHDFYLFTEFETGSEAVCYHRDDGRIGVIGPRGIGWEGAEDDDGIVREESRGLSLGSLEGAVAAEEAHRLRLAGQDPLVGDLPRRLGMHA